MFYVIIGIIGIFTILLTTISLLSRGRKKQTIEHFGFFSRMREQIQSQMEAANVAIREQAAVEATAQTSSQAQAQRLQQDLAAEAAADEGAATEAAAEEEAAAVILPTQNEKNNTITGAFTWKNDNKYNNLTAYNMNLNSNMIFKDEGVFKNQKVSFQEPVYFNNDIYLYGNSLMFGQGGSSNQLSMDSYKDTRTHINALNNAFTDDDYALEQDDLDELRKIGLEKKAEANEECNYFDLNKDHQICANKIWRRLRSKDIEDAPVCNCCCSPDTDETNCIVQLIKSNNKDPYVLQLEAKGEILYKIMNTGTQDDFVQISLQKSGNLQTCKLLFFNVEKMTGDTDNRTGLVKIMFNDEFDGNIIAYPKDLGIQSIKLIIE